VNAAPTDRLDRRTIVALVAMGLAVFLIANDITSLTVALPTIEGDFNVDVTTVQWVANAYTLAFGVLIVTGGRLSDILGRRRMFFAGAGIFAFFSVVAGLAPDAQVLIGARAAMAIGAALIWPAVVGILFSIVPAARVGIAGGLLLGVSGIGNAFGPLLGGFMTDDVSWRGILFLNIPIALGSALVVWRYVDADRAEAERERLDYAGVGLLSVGLVGLLVGLDQSSSWGWGDPRTLGLIGLGVLALAAMAAVQRRGGERALIPRDVIANPVFAAACLTTLLASGTWFAILIYGPQFMQKVLGFSALGSGLGFLPLMLVYTVTSFVAGPLYNRVGGRVPLLLGAACLALGALLLSLLQTDSAYAAMIPGLVVLGLGVGLFYSTLTTVAITSLDPARSSVGGGLLFMFQLVGGAIGVILTTTVFSAAGEDHSGADAFVDGLHAGLRVDAALALCALITAFWVIRRRPAAS
jgi:EmrB/QacA subfamily drug resistance transporter